MPKSKPNPPGNPLTIEVQDDENEQLFLARAKAAWRAKHYDTIPKRGRRSVADQCFNAIFDGFKKLGVRADPSEDFILINQMPEMVIAERKGPKHERLTLGRIQKMIRDLVPSIKPSTARKYARLWEREMEPGQLTQSERMALYLRTKKQPRRLRKAASTPKSTR